LVYNASHPKLTNDPARRRAAFSFCYDAIAKRDCSLVTFHIQRSSPTINDFFFFIPNGSCADSFTTDAWKYNNPPAPLNENYKECRKTTFSAFFDALGIAVGNASSITPLLIFVAAVLYINTLLKSEQGINRKVKNEEKSAIMDVLSSKLAQLKRLKDSEQRLEGEKENVSDSKNSNSILSSLLEEIDDRVVFKLSSLNPLTYGVPGFRMSSTNTANKENSGNGNVSGRVRGSVSYNGGEASA
jgi:hypothetical protein